MRRIAVGLALLLSTLAGCGAPAEEPNSAEDRAFEEEFQAFERDQRTVRSHCLGSRKPRGVGDPRSVRPATKAEAARAVANIVALAIEYEDSEIAEIGELARWLEGERCLREQVPLLDRTFRDLTIVSEAEPEEDYDPGNELGEPGAYP